MESPNASGQIAPSQTELKVFAAFISLLAIFAGYRMFTLPSQSTPTPQPGRTYTVTNKDFGKTLRIMRGDSIILAILFSDSNKHSITVRPEGILKQTEGTGTLSAENPGTAVITVTSQPLCIPGHLCPQLIFVNFKLTVSVL